MFCVMMICMPFVFAEIRLASWYIKSSAMGYLSSMNTCGSRMTMMILRFVAVLKLYSRF